MSRVLPILFNTEMVRAILDGRKTATRRVVKFPVNRFTHEMPEAEKIKVHKNTLRSEYVHFSEEPYYCFEIRPPYRHGDILYVRETWQYLYELDGNDQIIEGTGRYYYVATDTVPFDTYVDLSGITRQDVPWRPSIHMPKEAARIWLKVTDVRAERLQDIQNFMAEGIELSEGCEECLAVCGECNSKESPIGCDNEIEKFAELWDSTIKNPDLARYGWDANPWVWVIEFERCGKPESEGK